MEARAKTYKPQAHPYENIIKNEQTRDFGKSSTTSMVCFVCLFLFLSIFRLRNTLGYMESKHQVKRKRAILKQSAIETAHINKYVYFYETEYRLPEKTSGGRVAQR